MPMIFTKIMHGSIFSLVFIILKSIITPALKNFYLRSVSRLGDTSVRWILEHDELEVIGMHCYWKQPFLFYTFLVVFALIPIFVSTWTQGLLGALLLMQLFMIAWIDAATGYIPNFLNYGLIGSAFLENSFSLKMHLIHACIGYFFLKSISEIARKFSRDYKIGEGDVLFFAGLNAWIGWKLAFLSLFIGNGIALITCLILQQKLLRYAPYLTYGAIIVLHLPSTFLKQIL